MEKGVITNISVRYNVALISINNANFLNLNEIIASLSGISIDMITMTQIGKESSSLVFSVADDDVALAIARINTIIPAMCSVNSGNAKISVYGNGFKNFSSGGATILDELIASDAEVKLFSTSDTELSIVVEETFVDEIIMRIKK